MVCCGLDLPGEVPVSGGYSKKPGDVRISSVESEGEKGAWLSQACWELSYERYEPLVLPYASGGLRECRVTVVGT